jgi:hypothetical protein
MIFVKKIFVESFLRLKNTYVMYTVYVILRSCWMTRIAKLYCKFLPG